MLTLGESIATRLFGLQQLDKLFLAPDKRFCPHSMIRLSCATLNPKLLNPKPEIPSPKPPTLNPSAYLDEGNIRTDSCA